MEKTFMKLRVAAGLDDIRRLRNRLNLVTQAVGLAEVHRQRLALTMSEISTNIIRHAAPKSARFIEVRFARDHIHWLLDILDDGSPFDPLVAIQQESQPLGTGLTVIHALFPETHYHPTDIRSAGMNRIRLKLPIAARGGPRPRITVADDDPALRDHLRDLLSNRFQVELCRKGTDVYDAIRFNRTDMIIADVAMAGLSHTERQERMAEVPEIKRPPFIFLTTTDAFDLDEQAITRGVDDFLVKPIQKDSLQRTIKKVLEKSRNLRTAQGDPLDRKVTHALRFSPVAPMADHQSSMRTIPADGGDFLFQKQNDQGTTIILGDATGQGEQDPLFAHAQAAYLVGLIRALPSSSMPNQILIQLAKAVKDDPLISAGAITCTALTVTEDGVIRIAQAGHPVPLQVNDDGCQEIQVTGAGPSLNRHEGGEELTMTLSPGERLLVTTDGMLKTAADDSDPKKVRHILGETVRRDLNLPLDEAADNLLTVFQSLVGEQPSGDATFALLERTAN